MCHHLVHLIGNYEYNNNQGWTLCQVHPPICSHIYVYIYLVTTLLKTQKPLNPLLHSLILPHLDYFMGLLHST